MRKFKCIQCGRSYGWPLLGGTSKMIGDPVAYSLKHVKRCAYCVGHYPDGTPCNGRKK